MSTEKRIRLAGNETDSETIGGGFASHCTTDRPQTAELGARIRRADAILGEVVDALASGELSLYELGRYSPNAAGLFNLGHGYGYQARAEELKQAQWDIDRLYAKAFPDEHSQAMQARIDRAVASCPPGIDPLSPEWMHRALSAAIGGAA